MRVHLRPVVKDDMEWLLNHRNNPVLYANFNQPLPLTYAQQMDWYEKEILTKKAFAYTVTLNNVRIGYIALQNINWVNRVAEVSHFIDPEYDTMFAITAHLALMRIAFESLNINRIQSICFEFFPIYKELEKIGFKVEGTARQICFKDGKYHNGFYISILKEDFKSEGEFVS